jgi:hypothetical protein
LEGLPLIRSALLSESKSRMQLLDKASTTEQAVAINYLLPCW